MTCDTPCMRERAEKRRRKRGGKPDCAYAHPLEQKGCGLGRSRIMSVLSAERDALVRCYESELERAPEAEAAIPVTWTIASNGSVHSAQVGSDSTASNQLAQCVLGAIEGLTFPPPTDQKPVTVSYPFNFRDFCEPCRQREFAGAR